MTKESIIDTCINIVCAIILIISLKYFIAGIVNIITSVKSSSDIGREALTNVGLAYMILQLDIVLVDIHQTITSRRKKLV